MLTISFSLRNLVECTGIEPVVPEGGGFTVHCITIDASTPYSLLNYWALEVNADVDIPDYWQGACGPAKLKD